MSYINTQKSNLLNGIQLPITRTAPSLRSNGLKMVTHEYQYLTITYTIGTDTFLCIGLDVYIIETFFTMKVVDTKRY
jgi:hypothetical protein